MEIQLRGGAGREGEREEGRKKGGNGVDKVRRATVVTLEGKVGLV